MKISIENLYVDIGASRVNKILNYLVYLVHGNFLVYILKATLDEPKQVNSYLTLTFTNKSTNSNVKPHCNISAHFRNTASKTVDHNRR